MTVDELVAIAREMGFVHAKTIEKLARKTVLMQPSDSNGGTTCSKVGGLPALPISVPWPRWNGQSLAFIAQIALASLPQEAARELGIATKGLLLLFYDAEQSTWGFDPKNAGSFAVIYVPEPSQATVTQWPSDLPEQARYRECILSSEETITLPPWDSVLIDDLHLDQEQSDMYQNLLEKTYDEDDWSSRVLLGGYPDQIQGDMMVECAIVSAGLSAGDGTAYQSPRMPVFRKHAHDWRLLLQVPSLEEANMMWGDAGCLYFCIRQSDLKVRRFERCWMILQCG